MSLERVRAITQRILQQFRRDHRTLALLFGAPLVILALLGYLLRGGQVRSARSDAARLRASLHSRRLATAHLNASRESEYTSALIAELLSFAGARGFPTVSRRQNIGLDCSEKRFCLEVYEFFRAGNDVNT